jgi:hypothetical protein
VEKAENVAWAMINARIQFVELRRRKSSVPGVNLYSCGDSWPRATLETFSLLAEDYKERGLTAKMGPLWRSFQAAEIAPDSFMLNQLLSSLLQDKSEAVLPMYQELVERYNLQPDSHTFTSLWRALPVNQFTRIPAKDLEAEVSRTRALFAEMIKHISILRSKGDVEMNAFMARNILHSFRKLQDRIGLLLAYRGLRRLLNYNPSDMVVFEILLETLGLERLAQRKEGPKLIRARMSLDHYLAHRHRELVTAGEIQDGENMPPQIRSEEAGNFLELQLETAFSDMEEKHIQQLAIDAAQEMGLVAAQDAEPYHDSGHRDDRVL